MIDFRDTLKRAVWTFVQAFLTVLLASGADFINVSSARAAAIAGGAAVLSLAKSVFAQTTVGDVQMFNMPDWIERPVWTFAQTFVALLAAAGADYAHIATVKSAAVAALAAGLSAVKSYAAGRVAE